MADTERDRERRRETEREGRDRERQGETERDRKGQIERDNVICREKCFSLGRRCTFFALSSVPVSRACYNSTKNCQRYVKVSKRVVEDKTNRRCIIILCNIETCHQRQLIIILPFSPFHSLQYLLSAIVN
jgi:hypothetical protein